MLAKRIIACLDVKNSEAQKVVTLDDNFTQEMSKC